MPNGGPVPLLGWVVSHRSGVPELGTPNLHLTHSLAQPGNKNIFEIMQLHCIEELICNDERRQLWDVHSGQVVIGKPHGMAQHHFHTDATKYNATGFGMYYGADNSLLNLSGIDNAWRQLQFPLGPGCGSPDSTVHAGAEIENGRWDSLQTYKI